MAVFSIVLTLLILFAMTACSTWKPYGYAYVVDPVEADHWVHPKQSWTCDAPWFLAGVGGEYYKGGFRVGLHHYSAVQCGGPFNHKPEVHWSGIAIGGDWGGWK